MDRSQRTWQRSRTGNASHRVITARTLMLPLFASLGAVLMSACGGGDGATQPSQADTTDEALVAQGKQIFRFDTFGDESQWTDTLRMHEVIRTAVDPMTALSVGLKVDAEALPPAVVAGIQNATVD